MPSAWISGRGATLPGAARDLAWRRASPGRPGVRAAVGDRAWLELASVGCLAWRVAA